MCESSVDMSNSVVVPNGITEAHAIVDDGKSYLASRPHGFLHRSVLLCMFYGAMFLSVLKPVEAIGTADVVTLCGTFVYKVQRGDAKQDAIDTLTSLDAHAFDVLFGNTDIPCQLMQEWPPLVSSRDHLQFLPCTIRFVGGAIWLVCTTHSSSTPCRWIFQS